MIRVGIPRALLYYEYYPAWRTFFNELGAEVTVSPPTTQATVAAGAARVVADTCLPVKAYIGHVLSLPECDYLFIPAVRSVAAKAYNCAKFLGLPDMTRAVVPEAPPILDIEIDINLGKEPFYQALYNLGRHFTRNPFRIRRAARAAFRRGREYWALMREEQLTPEQAIGRMFGEAPPETGRNGHKNAGSSGTIAVIGHPYLVHDEYLNHRLMSKLEEAGYSVLTPEMADDASLERAMQRLVGRAYWTYEDEVTGAGGHYLGAEVAGVIGVMAFGCGPDSLMMDLVRRESGRAGRASFMCLSLEEHTAEAGLLTRLEAFLDMIARKIKQRGRVCV